MANLNTIKVGCKLPHGIILEHPKDASKKVELKGLNSRSIIGAEYVTNDVNPEFWAAWRAANKNFPALVSGAIFADESNNDISAAAKELSKEITGFEPLSPTYNGVEEATFDD